QRFSGTHDRLFGVQLRINVVAVLPLAPVACDCEWRGNGRRTSAKAGSGSSWPHRLVAVAGKTVPAADSGGAVVDGVKSGAGAMEHHPRGAFHHPPSGTGWGDWAGPLSHLEILNR